MSKTLLHNRYEIEDVFADSGGMGVLYAARDLKCKGNRVLIKTTRYDGGVNARHFRYTAKDAVSHIEKLRKIIAWEKKILVRFKNTDIANIPSVNDYFLGESMLLQTRYEGRMGEFALPPEVLEQEPYLVMEKISGRPLNKLLRDSAFRRDRLELKTLRMAKEILTIFIKIHKATRFGGQQGYFIYQDLKPANILVSPGDYFTLIDMGAVTLHLGGRTTEPTAGCITAGYAAPEAANGREARIDKRFDLYTLGVTMWEVLTGQDPQDIGGEFPELSLAPLREQGLHASTLKILHRALERDPDQRFRNAAEMRKAVIGALSEVEKDPKKVLH